MTRPQESWAPSAAPTPNHDHPVEFHGENLSTVAEFAVSEGIESPSCSPGTRHIARPPRMSIPRRHSRKPRSGGGNGPTPTPTKANGRTPSIDP